MLAEGKVVDITVAWLISIGYTDIQARKGSRKGHDIEAVSLNGVPLFVECKGSVGRDGTTLSSTNTLWRRASGAVFNQLKLRTDQPDDVEVGIALPDCGEYQRIVGSVADFLNDHGVMLYWVSRGGTVRLHGTG